MIFFRTLMKWLRILFFEYKYNALAPKAPINIDPLNIHYQLCNEKRKRPQWFPGDILDGDWDLDVKARYGE